MSFFQIRIRKEVEEKVKWNIDRESMQNKQRALIDLFKPLKKDLFHQVHDTQEFTNNYDTFLLLQEKLRKYYVFRAIKAFP